MAAPADQHASAPEASQSNADNGPGKFALGVKLSSLGLGAEAAVFVTEHSNFRAGFNVLGFSHTFTKDGIPYHAHLNLKTFEAQCDIFPWAGSFHISPGVLIYALDPIKANAFVAPDKSFTVGGMRFYSDSANPTTAQGTINFNRAAPMITVGWGNLISRKEGSRFSVPFEVGIAFQGSPKTSLGFGGNVCEAAQSNCSPAVANAAVQNNIASEEKKINNSLSFLKVYPIISSGFAIRF